MWPLQYLIKKPLLPSKWVTIRLMSSHAMHCYVCCRYVFIATSNHFWDIIFSCSKTNQMHQFRKFVLFWNNTPHVSDGLSVHHQEFKTVHTATGIRQTGTVACLLVGTLTELCSIQFPLASRQQYLFDIYLLLYVQSWTPDDGRKDRPKHVGCYSKIK